MLEFVKDFSKFVKKTLGKEGEVRKRSSKKGKL